METNRIWVIDDDASIRWVLEKALTRAGYAVELFERADGIPTLLESTEPEVIVTDIRMPGLNGLALLDAIKQNTADVPVIIMTAHTDLESAVAAYRGGAFEYLPKPFDVDEATALIARAVEHRRQEVTQSRPVKTKKPDIIGEAPAMQEVFRAIGRLSNSNMNVLICGESGTGKELVARALHNHSPRVEQPFIPINTAAIPSELLESELFGHEKGAFTGAQNQRQGRFEQAHHGTLFLDEIGDMPAVLQTRLLRVLSDGQFYRVGGHAQIKVDVRIIAATNQDLEKQVSEGKFREDLFHRLNVIRVLLPPLRNRQEDVPQLSAWFLQQTARELNVEPKQLRPKTVEYLSQCKWPGNVRQLENICRWLTVMAASQSINIEDLPEELQQEKSASVVDWETQLKWAVEQTLSRGEESILDHYGKQFERILLESALAHTGGRKQDAAKRLGWGRNTLTRKLKELGMEDKLQDVVNEN